MAIITKEEIKYLGFSVLFAFVFFVVIVPFALNKGLDKTMSTFLQFIIFNLAVFIFLQIYLRAKALSIGIKLRKTFELMLIFITLDLWIPPLMVTLLGNLSTEAILSASSSDYMFGYLATIMGLKGFMVYLFVYLFVPTVLLFIASKINGNFVRSV